MAKLIIYENGDRIVWNGRAEIHYHRTKIIKEHDLNNADFDEIESLKKNPHQDLLLEEIHKRK